MNLDRPPLESKEIQAGMNFGQLMVTYQTMSKPFYKTKWFFGTAGMASIGLIVGGTIAFQGSDDTSVESVMPEITDTPPLSLVEKDKPHELLAVNLTTGTQEETTEIYQVQTKHKVNDKNITPIINSDQSEQIVETTVPQQVVINQSDENQNQKSGFDPMDLTPRINGKMNGDITREDLMDNKGLTTNSDVSIIHFELHLIDGLGGKVFEEESNQLNQQMKTALDGVERGETIYFENIRGKTSDGFIVRLNPLRYVLLN
ncbi:MAG: hypothetical protein HYZ14_19170 [Bacteroidetes bacterium]|nr:hypothetical protein [Bacteroidota bacterium]